MRVLMICSPVSSLSEGLPSILLAPIFPRGTLIAFQGGAFAPHPVSPKAVQSAKRAQSIFTSRRNAALFHKLIHILVENLPPEFWSHARRVEEATNGSRPLAATPTGRRHGPSESRCSRSRGDSTLATRAGFGSPCPWHAPKSLYCPAAQHAR